MGVSRRVFLRMLGLAAASEALSGCLCYSPTPTPIKPASSQDLKVQAELLTEMGERNELEAETMARVRASVQRDAAMLALSQAGK